MTYHETLEYLESFQRFGVKLGLRNIKILLKLLGNPEKSLKVIHIGGTNGKGSVGAFLFYILKEAGYKVGLYTSPHLVDFRERIRTNRGLISKKELIKSASFLKSLFTVHRSLITDDRFQPTYFEIITAIALKYFADKKVDFAILEVGMGGRLDATNVTRSLVSVVTNVNLEHTEHLGRNLKRIASEKCGIIKQGIPVVTAENKKEVLDVINEVCSRKKAKLYRVGKELKYRARFSGLRYQSFNVKGIDNEYNNLRIPLLGKHQLLNAACAIGVVELLQPKVPPVRNKSSQATASDIYQRISNGIKITTAQIKQGLAKTEWPGRLDVKRYAIHGKRLLVILDGAHNVAGAEVLKKAIGDYFTYKKLVLVLGILKDKDIEGIISHLAPLASQAVITRPKTPRAVKPERIAKIARKYLDSIVIEEKVFRAIDQAFAFAERGSLILITGSLYLVGEVRAYLRG